MQLVPLRHATSHAFIVSAVSLLVLSASTAHAQPATAQAEVLFREGKRLIGEGNITAACDAFEGSFKIDESPSTLMNLADCRERNQQYASAWAHFVETARLSAKDPTLAGLATKAKERAAAVEPKLSYLIINVPDEARVDGLTITRNGTPVDPVEWNRDLPIDGGEYEIEGKAPAYEAWTTKVTIGNAKDKQSVNVPRFREAIIGATKPDRAQRSTRSKVVAGGLWIGGGLALGAGIGLELMSRGTYDDAKASTDNAERHDLTDKANSQRDLAMVAGAVGAVAVAAGVYVWVRGRPRERSVALSPVVTDRSATVVVHGSF